MSQQNNDMYKHIIQGDKVSFERFFKQFFPKLFLFSCDFVKDRDIAREIVHESFVKFWEIKGSLSPDTNIEAYLVTICRNRCLNYIKRQKVMSRFINLEQLERDILSDTLIDYNFDNVDFEKLLEKINTAIKNLPDQCRIVFEQSRFKRKKYGEIATHLNISVKTVEAHISLALKKLKGELKDFL